MTRRRVVVTGLGLVCPVGNSVAEGWQRLVAGTSGIAAITKFDASAFSCRFGFFVVGRRLTATNPLSCPICALPCGTF